MQSLLRGAAAAPLSTNVDLHIGTDSRLVGTVGRLRGIYIRSQIDVARCTPSTVTAGRLKPSVEHTLTHRHTDRHTWADYMSACLSVDLFLSCLALKYSIHSTEKLGVVDRRDLLGTCEASRFDSIRSVGLIRNFESAALAVVPQTTLTVQQINFNRWAVVIETYFMFMILCLC